MKITHLVVHYTATYPDQRPEVTAAVVDQWHRNRTPPFRKIGYHYFIRRDGTLEVGRAENEIGAHVGGQNTGKLGICWAGGLEHGSPKGLNNMTRAQERTLVALLQRLLDKYPGAKVVGHRDLAPTQCPGFNVAEWWSTMRDGPDLAERVAALEVRVSNIEISLEGDGK